MSQDSVKANRNFKNKNNLPYTLICDEDGKLIDALGFRKPPKGVQRGVIVIDKSGKILALLKGGPNATVEAVYPLIAASETTDTSPCSEATTIFQAAMAAHGADVDQARQQVANATVKAVASNIANADKLDEDRRPGGG